MQSEELITVRRCQYCGKEFRAWKPSLKLCSEACKQNKDFDSNLQILNALDKIKSKIAQAIIKPLAKEPAAPLLQTEHSPATPTQRLRSIRFVCKTSKAKAKHIPIMQPVKPQIAAIEPVPAIAEQSKRVSLGIRHVCRTHKAKVKKRIA